jgi:tRNA-Thr(GGU) m(6)t(6)A37 methyltransferase TsaA
MDPDLIMQISLKSIGVIHTPFQSTESMPIQSARSDAAGFVEVFPGYTEGLEGVDGFSHLILLYAFHLLETPPKLMVQPFLDDRLHGVFATRYPNRPNPIGLSVVRLIARQDNRLDIQGVDMLDGTPLLDIKPYVPDFDIHTATNTGWYAKRAHS